MAVVIRLRRLGCNKKPTYRLVVCDSRKPRQGSFLEKVGLYEPLKEKDTINFDKERIIHWLGVGAQPSENVKPLLRKCGILAEWREIQKKSKSVKEKKQEK
ncbi:MAG: 30S ribosomal protein S16 [Candidatus Ancaeobacter aquaticus]|nr:30S ribosomal protein S16 [Candidatus Ancaeobacter aquaticus]